MPKGVTPAKFDGPAEAFNLRTRIRIAFDEHNRRELGLNGYCTLTHPSGNRCRSKALPGKRYCRKHTARAS